MLQKHAIMSSVVVAFFAFLVSPATTWAKRYPEPSDGPTVTIKNRLTERGDEDGKRAYILQVWVREGGDSFFGFGAGDDLFPNGKSNMIPYGSSHSFRVRPGKLYLKIHFYWGKPGFFSKSQNAEGEMDVRGCGIILDLHQSNQNTMERGATYLMHLGSMPMGSVSEIPCKSQRPAPVAPPSREYRRPDRTPEPELETQNNFSTQIDDEAATIPKAIKKSPRRRKKIPRGRRKTSNKKALKRQLKALEEVCSEGLLTKRECKKNRAIIIERFLLKPL